MEGDLREISRMVRRMGKERFAGQAGRNILAAGGTVSSMALGSSLIRRLRRKSTESGITGRGNDG